MATKLGARKFYLLVDTETTMCGKVFDFAAIITDRKGNIYNKLAVIVDENKSKDLFSDNSSGFFDIKNVSLRKGTYSAMVDSGDRIIANIQTVNVWLDFVNKTYNPELTAYNLGFDSRVCLDSGIELNIFNKSFCLWQAATGNLCNKRFFTFTLDNHYFNNRTAKGNMTVKTNAEVMAHYVTGTGNTEPHTALEDVVYFELPILLNVIKRKKWRDNIKPYNWKKFVVRANYKA